MLPDDEETFSEAFESLLEEELIEVVGINSDGEWLYGATEKGRKLYQTIMILKNLGDDDN